MAPPHDGAKGAGRTRSRRVPQHRRRGGGVGGQHGQQQQQNGEAGKPLLASAAEPSMKAAVSPTSAVSIDGASVGTPARAVQRVLAGDAVSAPAKMPEVGATVASTGEPFPVQGELGAGEVDVNSVAASGNNRIASRDLDRVDPAEIPRAEALCPSVNGFKPVSGDVVQALDQEQRGEPRGGHPTTAGPGSPVHRGMFGDLNADQGAAVVVRPPGLAPVHDTGRSESPEGDEKLANVPSSSRVCSPADTTTVGVPFFSVPSPELSVQAPTIDPHAPASVGMSAGVATSECVPSSAAGNITMNTSREQATLLPSFPVLPSESDSSWTSGTVRSSPETAAGDASMFQSAPSVGGESVVGENAVPSADDVAPLMASGSFWSAVSNGSTPADATGWTEDKTDEKDDVVGSSKDALTFGGGERAAGDVAPSDVVAGPAYVCPAPYGGDVVPSSTSLGRENLKSTGAEVSLSSLPSDIADAYQIALASVPAAPLSFWPGLRMGRLRNGLEYRILQHPFPAHKIAAHLIIYAGSLHEEDNEQGLAHLLEHCVFQGTRKFPSAAKVRKELAALGMSFGGDLNAYTDFHHTAYTLHSPVESQMVFEDEEEVTEEEEEQQRRGSHRHSGKAANKGHGAEREVGSVGESQKENAERGADQSKGPVKVGRDEEQESASTLNDDSSRISGTEKRESGMNKRKKKRRLPSNLERCLVLLRELAFAPLLESGEPLEGERHAVLSEEQLRHSVQYRVEKRMLGHLHSQNKLAHRFPIGLTSQVKKFTAEDLRRFQRRWYIPANACLVLVADQDADLMVDLTERIFSPVPEDPHDVSLWQDEERGQSGEDVSGSVCGVTEGQQQRQPLSRRTEGGGGTGKDSDDQPSSVFLDVSRKPDHFLSAEEAWSKRGVIRFQSGGAADSADPAGTPAGGSEAVAWAMAGAAINKPGGVALPTHPDAYDAPPVREALFQHPLLKGLAVVISGKEELTPWLTTQDLFTTLVDTCISSILQTRLSDGETSRREPLFLSASWTYSNSARENCAWNVLTVAAASLKTWRDALEEVLRQIGSLCDYGIEQAELNWIIRSLRKCYRDSMSQQECQAAESIVDEIVETCLTGCIMTSRKQEFEAYEQLVGKITPDVIQARSQQVFYHIRHYSDEPYAGTKTRPRASLFVYAPTHEPTDEDLGLRFSGSSSMSFCGTTPTSSLLTTARAASICSELIPQGSTSPCTSGLERRSSRSFSRGNSLPFIPGIAEEEEEGTVDEEEKQERPSLSRVIPLTTEKDIEPGKKTTERTGGGHATTTTGGGGGGGTGAEFVLRIDQVSTCIQECLQNRAVEPEGFHIPETLLDPERFEAHVAAHPAIFVPPLLRNGLKLHGVNQVDIVQQFAVSDGYHDEDLDLHFWKFKNGAAVNAKTTTFEKNRCQVRLFFMGGESMANENERQLLDLGFKTLMDGGVADHPQKSVDKLCALWGVFVSFQVEPEGVTLAVVFDSEQEEALDRVFELIHCYLVHPSWNEDVFQRQKQSMKTAYEMSLSNLDFLSSVALAYQLYPEDRRWVPANSSQLESYTLSQAREAVERQLQPHLLEVAVVGDFKIDELKTVVKKYIGTLPEKLEVTSSTRRQLEEDGIWEGFKPVKSFKKSKFIAPFLEEKHFTERCSITVALPGFGRYQKGKDGDQKSFSASPIYRFRVWRYIEEITNNRLHDQMRERRQLGYSFSCHTASLEFQDSGVLIFGATPRPAYAAKAWDSLCSVIRDLCTARPPTREEYNAAKQVLTSGFTTSFKTNDYWLTLLFSLQLPTSPKDLDSIKKIPEFYERISLQDVCEVLRETCFAVPMITCVAISGPKEIKSLLARTERAVEGKVKSQLLPLARHTLSSNRKVPWSETPSWPEDLPVDEEWEAYTRRQALTRASSLSRLCLSPREWLSKLSSLFCGDADSDKTKRKLLVFLGVAVLTGTAAVWFLSSRRRTLVRRGG